MNGQDRVPGEGADSAEDGNLPGFWRLAWSRPVRNRALRVAAIVGSLLFAINYGDRLLNGVFTGVDALKVVLTYLVPYGVSTWSAVSALRQRSL